MFAASLFPQIPSDEVFEHINASTTVITPNRRLALALKEQFSQRQIARNAVVWHSIDVLPFTALIERCHSAALYSEQSYQPPLLLSLPQELALWESVIRNSAAGETLLRIPQTAQQAQEAWQLAHAWRLIGKLRYPDVNEDSAVFLGWAQSYREITARNRQIEQARLCDWIIDQYDTLGIDKLVAVICYGFDVFTPQQITFLQKLTNSGCSVTVANAVSPQRQSQSAAQRFECLNAQDEIYRAAAWTRDRLEADHTARIGVVVPELARCRSAVIRIFTATMHPDVRDVLPGAKHLPVPFNISLGLPLAAYPLIETALTALVLIDRQLDYATVSQWLRSPFLMGAESEMMQRALLDVRCRKYAEPVVTLERFLVWMRQAGGQTGCPQLWRMLIALSHFRRTELPETSSHAVYAEIVTQILSIVGFPGERSLDSIEYQTAEKWRSLIVQWATLDHVNPQVRYREAIDALNRMAHDTLFQPETPAAPVQILGVLEAAGMTFDHLWVMGLSDECWPLRARPNPFLPFVLQCEAGLPLGSMQAALAYCRKLTDGWLACAPEVVFSSPQFSSDRDARALKPSPLIHAITQAIPVFREQVSHRDAIIASATWQYVEDCCTHSVRDAVIKGGVAVLKDYAACPFRAWARHRMAIARIAEPHAGLDAMERGALVHQVLALIWLQLKNKAALDALCDIELEQMLEIAAGRAITEMQPYRATALSGRAALIEQQRLVKLVKTWLDQERTRGPFSVIAIEEKRSIQLGELHLDARLDRVDELESGQHLVIDYKTKKQSVAALLGERPDEPQLPLYLTMTEAPQQAAGVAFAAVKEGEMNFSAIVRDDTVLPGVKAYSQINGYKQYAAWDDLLATWRQNLTRLADGFCSGDACVDPKQYPLTCAYCDLHLLCRIHERVEGRVLDEGDGDD